MAEAFKRIESSDATDALMLAMERAGDIQTVVVIYSTRDGVDHDGGFILPKGTTLPLVLWLLETFRHWLLKQALGEEG